MAGYSPVSRMRRRLWLVGLAAFGVGLAAGLGRMPSAQAGGPILVTTTVDEMTVNGQCSLREAVQAANLHGAVDSCLGLPGANTIVMPPGTYVLSIPKTGANDNTSGNLNLTSNIVLGPNLCLGICFSTIISGAAGWDDQMMRISNNAQVTLSQLIIQGGNTDLDGGAAKVANGWLTLTGTAIINNRAGSSGGGISSVLSNLTIINSSIVSNTALAGGGVWSLGATIVVRRSTIMSNTTSRFGGAGIGVSGVSFPLTLDITDSALRGNAANGSGGGLNAYVASVNLSNTTVSGNSAGVGGGLYVELSNLDLNNVTVAYNTGGNGGGLRVNTQATVTLVSSILALNTDPFGGKPDCNATLKLLGYNLIQNTTGCTFTGVTTGNRLGLDPLLLPLVFTNHTWVHPLHFLSPAIDAGNPANPLLMAACAVHDQRGQPRPVDGDGDAVPRCDMGAYEVQTPTIIRRLRLPAVQR